ncbi:MAG: lytic transglycosylase domain-containing protein [Cytophagaceae bacterium]
MRSLFYLLLGSLFIYSCKPDRPQEVTLDKSGSVAGPKLVSTAVANEIEYEVDTIIPPQKIRSVPIPKSVTFAGQEIPLDRSDVREALEYELMVNTFRHSHTLKLLKNIERWKPLVLEILREHNVPEDFIYLAVAESEFDNNAQSYAGAVGMWQFMEGTAKDYKLVVNKDVDMRKDPKLSTIAACKFLTTSYEAFNDWILTTASYNRGIKGIKNRLEEQKVDNFFDLHLNPETARYVYRIIALKIILENPELYGYFLSSDEKYKPYKFKTITITDDVSSLVDFAQQHNTTYKELRLLNPWFNDALNLKLKVGKKEAFELRVPEKD